MSRARPEQLGWGLVQNLAITASGNYFIVDFDGNVQLDFNGDPNKNFSIKSSGSKLFEVKNDGKVTITGDLNVSGNISGTISGSSTNALTASHLEEQNVATFRPIETPQMFVTGGIFRSSSGDWFIS